MATRPRPTKILALGRNFRAHVAAMGPGPGRADPVLFMKPPSALVASGQPLWYPPDCRELHPEGEIVIVMGKRAQGVAAEEALGYVAGYAAGLDMTDRGWQEAAKAAGHPWEYAKAFDGSAALTAVVPADSVADWRGLRVVLAVDGRRVQEGSAADMLLGIPGIVAFASRRFTLEPGDLIFTGAPGATAAVAEGAELEVELEGLAKARHRVTRTRPSPQTSRGGRRP